MTESGFDPGLDDPDKAGVFFVAAGDLATLGAAAHDAGLVPRHIDLMGCANKATMLLRISVAMDFPHTSGRNWDALSDRLRDLQWLQAQGYVLLFDGAGDMHEVDENSFDMLISVLDEASSSWASRGVPFWAFLALRDEDFARFED